MVANREQDKHNLLDDPTFPAAGIAANVGIYRGGIRIGTGVVTDTPVVLIQMRSTSRSRGLLASVNGRRLRDSLLVERDRRSVEETRAHLRVRELGFFRWGSLAVRAEGSGECGDKVPPGREFHFLGRDLGDVIPHGRREECVLILRVTGFAH